MAKTHKLSYGDLNLYEVGQLPYSDDDGEKQLFRCLLRRLELQAISYEALMPSEQQELDFLKKSTEEFIANWEPTCNVVAH